MAECCKHGIDPRHCALCNPPARLARARGPTRRTGRSRRASTPAPQLLDCHFEEGGRTLVSSANLDTGWRRERRRSDQPPRKSHCFSEVSDVQWRGGSIHIHLSVFARGVGGGDAAAVPPSLDEVESSDGCCALRGGGRALRIDVALLDELREREALPDLRTNSGGDEMFERIWECSDLATSRRLEIQFRATFKPPRKPTPVEYSFWNDFLPGGRPESDRRKF